MPEVCFLCKFMQNCATNLLEYAKYASMNFVFKIICTSIHSCLARLEWGKLSLILRAVPGPGGPGTVTVTHHLA